MSSAPDVAAAADASSVLLLFSGMLDVASALLGLARALASFAAFSVPHTLYAALSYSLTLQLPFSVLAPVALAGLFAAFTWFRHSLRVYEKLREPPLDSDAGFSLHPDFAVQDSSDPFGLYGLGSSTGTSCSSGMASGGGFLHDYLDDFLRAIRIFGYLERPVFHDLARHLQTRRLIAGDSLPLDRDGSFYLVIDGSVGVYAPLSLAEPTFTPSPQRKFGRSNPSLFEDSGENYPEGFQLLHRVDDGGTLSSLFTILKLFVESSAPSAQTLRPDWDPISPAVMGHMPCKDGEADLKGHLGFPPQPQRSRNSEILTGTVAWAHVDTTLAVIPGEAFRRLTKKYPTSAAHILQGTWDPQRLKPAIAYADAQKSF